MNFTAKNVAELRKQINTEFRGLKHCVEFLKTYWKQLSAIGKVDGLMKEHLTAEWIIKQLNGTNDCQNGVLGRTRIVNKETKETEFVARNTWTPGIVLDYLRKATRAQWKAQQEILKANKA